MAFGISEQTIEEIKARTDLADLIAGYGIQVKRAGGSYKACCPFHHEKTPSFNIQPSKGFYHCFGCGESGDVIKFVMKYEGLGFVEAAKKLAAAANITIEETNSDPQAAARKRQLVLHAELAAFYRRCLKTATEAARARDYLASRDIPDDIAEKFQIGYAPQRAEAMLTWAEKHHFTTEELEAAGVLRPPKYPGGRWYSPFAGRVMFSIRDRSGRVIAFSGRTLETDKTKMRGGKYVNSPETLIFRKSDVLYAFDLAAGKIANAKPVREAIVCEGQIDVIRCHAAGFSRAIASQGTAFTKEHVQILKKVADAAVLVFDADAAGQKAAIRTGGEMLAAGLLVRVASLPPGEDPDSLLRTKGPEAFQACLDAAESLVAFQVRIARAMEQTPDSYDAISRAARAVLALVRCSSSAVMRASLLQEASTLLKIPVAALEEDLEKGSAFAKATADKIGNRERGARNSELGTQNSQLGTLNSQLTTHNSQLTTHNSQPSDDAAAPENNPPPRTETALMEFLFGNGPDGQLADMLESYAPDTIFIHALTRGFVRAYVQETRGNEQAMAELRGTLSETDGALLEGVFLSRERASLSELEPVRILEDFLRRLWVDAIRRCLGELPARGDAELEHRRLSLSMRMRKLKNAPWQVARTLMVAWM